jgi:hypothetical protein
MRWDVGDGGKEWKMAKMAKVATRPVTVFDVR